VTEFRRSSFDVEHRLTIGGKLALDGVESGVWATRAKDDPDKTHGIAIPDNVIAQFG
jgi:4-hydroxybenzoyl-CoA thioesterase